MIKSIFVAASFAIVVGLFSVGCTEWLVGAPCTPETDEGEFNTGLSAESTYLVETRSVQCKTSICLTKIQLYREEIEPDADNDFDRYCASQNKYSFCSCRCQDKDGNKYDRNVDKYDDLCECPPNTRCVRVLGDDIATAPDKIKGSYCIPKCIDDGCPQVRPITGPDGEKIQQRQVCIPSSDSKEPWNWKCQWPEGTSACGG